MSASASQVPCGKYDVFISFRGPDVRFGFLSHLERELRRKNIVVYVDNMLERGEEISSSLLNAIEGSMIALVIFSKDYASSRWCLDELVKIMECNKAGQQIVIPVFYLVDPSDVRHQKRTYAEAFTLHEENCQDKVEIWRSVLKKSASIAGYDSSKFQDEPKLIVAIVEDVFQKLGDNSPIDQNSQLIGSHQNVTIVESLMEFKSPEVRLVGIWGMGGIGKTTLARDIFDRFSSKFERCCFLEDVRRKSTDGLNSLRDKLLSQLLDQKERENNSLKWLQMKKVLITLDDVDNPMQLKYLVGCLQLGPSSRVIVTSRDKHALRSGGIRDEFIHEVNELSSEESLELFSRHAFKQSRPKQGYEKLSQKTMDIAKGIPLALEVLGSHFYYKDEAYWESELSKLEMYPRKQIQAILEISYHGLDPMDKEIFLDIAFFWLTSRKDKVTYYLEAFGFKAVSGIQNLIDKALIKLVWNEYILMHDLIQEMAEQIVRGESKGHLKRCSRLKDADEIYDALTSKTEMDEIEGIELDVRKIQYVQVEADIFLRMKNLRFLAFYDEEDFTVVRPNSSQYIDIHSDLDHFPDKLRYLCWHHYPSKTLPLGSYLKNLVEIYIPNSNVERLWDGKQDLGNLRTIDLSFSKQLIELPDLSMAHKLESVYLKGCESLRSVHPSILSLPNIIAMNVFDCSTLESIERETRLKRFFPDDFVDDEETEVEIIHLPIHCFRELKDIRLCGGGMVGSAPRGYEACNSTNLKVFEVTNYKRVIDIKLLHSLFDAWPDFRKIRLEGCRNLSEIPDNIKALTWLKYLSLKDSAVETLPTCVSHLSSLEEISLRRCKRLKSILGLPPFLQELDASECTLLETVSSDLLVWLPCVFNFCNCEKLDERSLRYIQELRLSSMTSNDTYDGLICYPGSRVPEWMEYKPMTEAFNATEFTCNLEGSQRLLCCCVAPSHLIPAQLKELHYYFSHNDNKKLHFSFTLSYPPLNRDHVLLWSAIRPSSRIGNDAKISFEFFLEYWHEVERASYEVPAKACGVHLLHYLEPGRSRKRVADIRLEDQLPSTKHCYDLELLR